MRSMVLRRALALAGTALILSTTAVYADNIVNNLDASVDAVAEIMALNVGGSDGTTRLYVDTTGSGPTPDDGKSGCNLTGSTILTVSVTSSDTSVATVSPNSVTFTSCVGSSAGPILTITPHNAGSASITLSQTANTTGGTFSFATATFTVNVGGASNTAPDVSISGVTGGATYEFGSVPSATCNVTDAEDGDSSSPATLSSITGPLSAYGLGSQTASCSYTDNGGLTDSDSVTYEIVDTADPVIAFVSRTLANSNGWNNTDVTLTWSCSDAQSGVVSSSVSQTVSSEGSNQSATGTCVDGAGNDASDTQISINIDKTSPSTSASAAPAPNANGWNNANVTVSFSGNDGTGSGIDSCDTAVVLSAEAAGQSATGSCTDLAGNSSSATASGINIDKTAPSTSASAAPAPNANGWNNTDVTVSFSGNDGLSGIASCSANVVLISEGAGQSASGTCTDLAGNASSPATASGIHIDKTVPSVSLVGGPANGGSYYFGSVPATPTCSAFDVLSGIDGACAVSGYSNLVGTHTVSASASDNAGNSASASASYSVLAWTLNGFYQPVDMNGVFNVVKGGSTVPLKFEIFAGSTELTDVAFVKSLTYGLATCNSGATTDDIETVATGGTSLRYDATGGQFIYNWKTPATAGKCYRVTMTTQDGSSLQALFKVK
jgi:hypothetical protein